MPMPPAPGKSPLVSVIMAHGGGASYLEEAILSVLAQSLRDLELIVSDDGSRDSSLDVALAAERRDPRIRVIRSEVARGPAAARNRALDAASGDWIAIVDSDDLLHPRRLERLIATAGALGADGVADDLVHFGAETGRTLLQKLELSGPLELTPSILVDAEARGRLATPLGYLKPVIRRRALAGLRYDEALRIGEDFDLLLRTALSGARIFAVPEALYLYRRHSTSTSHRLGRGDIDAMILGLRRTRGQADLPEDLARNLRKRESQLELQAGFADLVAALKARDLRHVLGRLASSPSLVRPLAQAAAEHVGRRLAQEPRGGPARFVLLGDPGGPPPARYARFTPQAGSRENAVRLAALPRGVQLELRVHGREGLDLLGHVPGWKHAEVFPPPEGWSETEAATIRGLPWPVTDRAKPVVTGLVHVRTPTYRRPRSLERCLGTLISQTHQSWVCDVFDDDPERSGAAVVERLADPRIRYRPNPLQNYASANIDRCFSRANPHRAEYFCVLEDDNQLLPRFMEENIRAARARGVEIVFRNQLIEHDAETPAARLSDFGILDQKFTERVYSPDHFRLALVSDIGVSNGGLFWSHRAVSDLEVHVPCSATLQEYYRTFAIEDPILVAMEPLAVWAENGAATTRDLGARASRYRRELSLKSSVARLQRAAWLRAPQRLREGYLSDASFRYPRTARERGLARSLISVRMNGELPGREVIRLAIRGALIRLVGRPEAGLSGFLKARNGRQS